MKIRRESLPLAKYERGEVVLSNAYGDVNYITCTPYGEMADGTMVWTDENGKQYTRNKFFGKYFFFEM